MTTATALTVAALRDILADCEETAVVWVYGGPGGIRVLTDRYVRMTDTPYAGDLVLGTSAESDWRSA